MSEDIIPEPDRIEGAPHPRDTRLLIGQDHAEADVLDAYAADRLHHAWLLTGPLGVGKATLAWRLARFLLATPEAGGGGLSAMPRPRPRRSTFPTITLSPAASMPGPRGGFIRCAGPGTRTRSASRP